MGGLAEAGGVAGSALAELAESAGSRRLPSICYAACQHPPPRLYILLVFMLPSDREPFSHFFFIYFKSKQRRWLAHLLCCNFDDTSQRGGVNVCVDVSLSAFGPKKLPLNIFLCSSFRSRPYLL